MKLPSSHHQFGIKRLQMLVFCEHDSVGRGTVVTFLATRLELDIYLNGASVVDSLVLYFPWLLICFVLFSFLRHSLIS